MARPDTTPALGSMGMSRDRREPMTSTKAATVAAALRHIERCHQRYGCGPTRPKEFRADGAVQVRIEGTDDAGVTLVRAATPAHVWRLSVFGTAMRLRVRVELMEGE